VSLAEQVVALGSTCGSQSYASSHPTGQFFPLGLSFPLYSSIRAPESAPPALIPLNECILAIAWELDDRLSNRDVIKVLDNTPLESFVTLLRSAAKYQAKLESVSYFRIS
jgi:hypothetical protein